ncbi:MAG: DUF5403 family protein [Isosphaeraceae bacterium]
MVFLIGEKAMNGIVAHLDEVESAVHREAEEIGERAKANLEAARGTTHWHKIHPETSPPHQTSVKVEKGTDPAHTEDSFVFLEGLNPMAIEFGHAPSGVFGPGGELGHLQTKAPHGLYILTGAAGLDRLAHVSSGFERGKR